MIRKLFEANQCPDFQINIPEGRTMLNNINDYGFDLADFSQPISCNSPDAQVWFNRGLVWTYGFNHEEAVHCFRNAAASDPECAMAYWGIAYAAGPNYNRPWEFFTDDEINSVLVTVCDALEMARSRLMGCSSCEKSMIEALSIRYQDHQATRDQLDKWTDDFANAMRQVNLLHPDSSFVESIFVEAMMCRTPWEFWDRQTGEPQQGSDSIEAREILEHALTRSTRTGEHQNPGLLHMYIHLMEMTPWPELARPAANSLRNMVPDSGHLLHMASHIDILCGDYQSTYLANTRAVEVDGKFLREYGPVNYYTFYRCHNYHFKIYGAVFLGNYRQAIEAAEELATTLPEQLLQVEMPPMADWLECFMAERLHVWVRFGKWEDILAFPIPDDRDLYCATIATQRYARAVARAATGDVASAERERDLFEGAYGNVPYSRFLFNNTYLDILAVAREMMFGEIQYRCGHVEEAFEHLRKAIVLSDNLPYDQAWGWMQPVRHVLGALLLEQGRLEEALDVYLADLGQDEEVIRACRRPGNIWGLAGCHECLTRLGRKEEASRIWQQLNEARKLSDSSIEFSCYCRIQ